MIENNEKMAEFLKSGHDFKPLQQVHSSERKRSGTYGTFLPQYKKDSLSAKTSKDTAKPK